MIKVRNKILISLLLVISIFAIGSKSFAADELIPSFEPKTVNDISDYIKNNKSYWFELNPLKDKLIMNKKLNESGADFAKKYIYCIDPHTGRQDKNSSGFKIVNLIDINNADDISIYALKKDEEDEEKKIPYLVNKDKYNNKVKKNLFAYSKILYKALEEEGTKWNSEKGKNKIASSLYFWGHFNTLTTVNIAEVLRGKDIDLKDYPKIYKQCFTDADEYGNKMVQRKIIDKTKKSKLKGKIKKDKNDKEKAYLGPYQVEFGGEGVKLDQIIIKQGDKKTPKTKVALKPGGDLINLDEVKSGKNFYIVIDGGKESANKITEITIQTTEYEVYKARIALLHGFAGSQNFEAFYATKELRNLETKLPVPDDITTKLKIKKVDKDNNNIVLPNVKFLLKHETKGYVKANGIGYGSGYDNRYVDYSNLKGNDYTDMLNRHIFMNNNSDIILETDQNGMVEINNAAAGQYKFIEIDNPNTGYEKNICIEMPFEYKLTDTKAKVVTNKKETGTHVIIKKVRRKADGTLEPLANVGFKLKHEIYGYVNVSGTETKYYADEKMATEFYSKIGGTDISKLQKGKYKFIETSNPYTENQLSIGMQKNFELLESDREKTVEVVNEPDPTGSLIIDKIGITSEGETIKLNNVKFKLKHPTAGYVKKSGNEISYTKNIDEAYEFETGPQNGKDGRTEKIDGLKVGEYTVIETYNGNENFKENEGKTTIINVTETSPDRPIIEEIENPMDDMGDLKIIKIGNNGKRLPNVIFKLKNNISGYVYIDNGEVKYTSDENDKELATKGQFTTNENGEITIEDLKVGDYTLYEIHNPNKPYVENPNKEYQVIIESNKTNPPTEIIIPNESTKGRLKITKEDEITKEPLKDVTFVLENKEEGYVQSRGKDVVYTNEKGSAEKFTTNQSGVIEIEGLEVGDYTVHEIENKNDGYERYPENTTFEATVNETDGITWSEEKYTNTPRLGKITIKKKVEGSDVLMGGVGFILEHVGKDGKEDTARGFVSGKIDNGTKAKYDKDRDNAEIFYTATEGPDIGTVTIEGLLEGKYNIYEVENNYYGFEIDPDEAIDSVNVISEEDSLKTIGNKQKYIKLRGYVWEDHIAGKGSVPNAYYDGETSQDEKVFGIRVFLKEGDTIIDQTLTDENGTYEFVDVEIDKLGSYYIEFEYNGLKYTNVIPHIDADTGSKAAEPSNERQKLNEKFSKIERGDNPDRQYGITKDASGNTALNLKYRYEDHIANIDKIATFDPKTEEGKEFDQVSEGYASVPITANTTETSYSIQNEYMKQLQAIGIVEYIDNINLGIYQREQPDIALVKDIQSIKINANHKEHVYEYANRFDNVDNPDETTRFGVEYGSKFKEDVYERPVYKADYEWAIKDSNNRQFEVYITYKIALRNESTSLVTQVNSIVDYYDSRYNIEAVGNRYSSEGAKIENINNAIGEYNNPSQDAGNGYNKTVINLNDMKIQPQTNSPVYVQFKLTTDGIKGALQADRTTDLYKNIAEINSYSTYDKNGKIYAGIDEDSAPNNIVLGDTNTYEDDVDIAPAMRLKITETRTMQGKVFLDQTTGELRTGEIREGNGELDGNDKPIEGVEVKLKESEEYLKEKYPGINKSAYEVTVKTGPDGNFTIENYIASDYTLSYTWGGQTVEGVPNPITVQNYKATVYKDRNRESNVRWHWQSDKKYSDAFDNIEIRKQIDDQIKTLQNNSGKGYDAISNKITEMVSTTPKMSIEVEHEYDTLISTGETTRAYNVNNIDFGIVRRAKQSVKLEKRISEMKITLPNGQVVSDVKIDKKGGILGGNETKHTTYMGPFKDNPGFIKAELDNELIQDAKVEVIYEVKFKNMSEVDIMNNDYYNYGSDVMGIIGNTSLILNGNDTGKKVQSSEVITITPVEIVDYLDGDWGYEANKNQDSGKEWVAKTKEEFEKQYIKDESGNIIGLINKDVIENTNSEINDRKILVTQQLQKENIVPGGDRAINLKVSKSLSSTDEISLGNETEIVKLQKTGGSEIMQNDNPGSIIPGSYIPGTVPDQLDSDRAEKVIVTPSTGENLGFVIPITIAVIALVILGTGIVLIKKKAIDSKK